MSVSCSLVFDGSALRAVLFQPGLENLLVTFDHRKIGKSDFGEAQPVKQALKRGFSVLRVQSARNDWFINAEIQALEAALGEMRKGYARANAIGYSMGGYGVFRFADCLSLDAAIAVSPQFSVSPEVVPWDPRFFKEAPDFDPEVGALATPQKSFKALILVDPFHRADLRNATMIREVFANTRLLRLGFAGHPASTAITRGGNGGALMAQVLAREPSPAAIRRAFGETRRQSPVFLRRIAQHSAARRPELANWARQRLATLELA